MKLTSEQIAELRQKAEAATPGRWAYNEYFNCIQVQPGFRPVCSFSLIPPIGNRDYIAATSPQAISALLDDLEEARKAFQEVRHALQYANDNPNGGINDTLWMMHQPETVFDYMDSVLDGWEPAHDAQTIDNLTAAIEEDRRKG